MIKYITLLVERPVGCPHCGHVLNRGGLMYLDDYRGVTVCGYCRDEYEDDILKTEGEDGRLLK